MKSHLSLLVLVSAVTGLTLFTQGCTQVDSTQVASSGVTNSNTSSADLPSEVEPATAATETAATAVTEASAVPAPEPEVAAAEPRADESATEVNALPPSADAEVTEQKKLTIGDPAPPLSIAKWVTGEPISALQEGQVYVVEFWATWCPPCRTSMPHLSKLQEEYADQVHFVGVSDEQVDTVESFLEKEQSAGKTWRDVVKYRLAIDASEATSNDYMRAASQNGIPCAFIVGRTGRVEWMGHPMTMDQPLAKIVAGEWDTEAAVAEFRQQQRVKDMQRELSMMFRAQQWDEALEKLTQLETEMGPNANLHSIKLQILQAAGRTEEAAVLQAQMVEELWDNASALNQIAWNIAIGSGERDLALALKAAQRGVELTEEKDGSILDTLARVHFEQGDLEQALLWQRKAVEFADGNTEIIEALQRYEAAKAESDKASPTTPAAEESQAEAAPSDGAAPNNN